MQEYNTFWKIIKESEIVIPTIQRDYAYGRDEANNILNNLLGNIKNSLDSKNDQLHLAFVYGKLDGKQNDELRLRNSENIKSLLQSIKEYANDLDIIVDFDANQSVVRLSDNVKFIPIDGQQRLTTLFLLHWYLAIHLDNKLALTEILRKFKYATRTSSREFCELICSIETPNTNIEVNSDFITNQEGYFKQWHNDPTVKNMLIVVDRIDSIFKNSKDFFIDYWDQLTNKNIVCFDFFDLDNFQLTDELYVKMNSRGKKLTQFENFKAWLYHIKAIDVEIKKNIDIAWYDMFWKAQGLVNKDIDTAYLQWFKNLFLADYLKKMDSLKSQDLTDDSDLENYEFSYTNDFYNSKSTIAILRNGDGKFLDFILASNEAKDIVLANIDAYLNKLGKIVSIYKEHLNVSVNLQYYSLSIEQLLFTEQNRLNWWQVTFQYAIVEYLSQNKYEEESLTNYLRVISNLIFNTAINGPKDYLLAIKSIDKILEEFNGDILKYLIDKNVDGISFFSTIQKNEEKIKAKKCLDSTFGKDWKQAIIEAENHKYFYGQIGFLFSLLKENDLKEFKRLNLCFKNVFSELVLQKENNFLFRALLTELGKPLFIKDGNILRFPINDGATLRTRNENWRRSLLDLERIEMIAGFIKNPELESLEGTVDFLNAKISNYKPNDSFLYPIIKNQELLKNAKRNCLCDYNENFEQIYLLNTSSLRGNYRELYLMDWFLTKGMEYNDSIIEISVKEIQYDIDDEPGLRIIVKNSSNEYYVYRNYSTKLFDLQDDSSSLLYSNKDIDNIIDFIKREKV